jgi:hypothetical protein
MGRFKRTKIHLSLIIQDKDTSFEDNNQPKQANANPQILKPNPNKTILCHLEFEVWNLVFGI